MCCIVVEKVIWLIYLIDDVHVQLQYNATSCFTPADGRDFGNSRCSELIIPGIFDLHNTTNKCTYVKCVRHMLQTVSMSSLA